MSDILQRLTKKSVIISCYLLPKTNCFHAKANCNRHPTKTGYDSEKPPKHIVCCSVILSLVQSVSEPTKDKILKEEQSVPDARIPSISLVRGYITKQPSGKT